MAKKNQNLLGSWAFTIGVIVAVLLGFLGSQLGASTQEWLFVALVILGIVVGLLNVTGDESATFLTTAAILVFVSWAGASTLSSVASSLWLLGALIDVFQSLNVLFIPATIVVAIKTVFSLARD